MAEQKTIVVLMLGNWGIYEAGKTYDLVESFASFLIRNGLARETKKSTRKVKGKE